MFTNLSKNQSLFVQSLNKYFLKKIYQAKKWYSVIICIDLIQNRLNSL